ncbi:hypothetical protein L211DRAFT_302076 [Terfezia boudieri ATCC MYA-4762]|uniref:Uncharacterized protein n=1 Tax=Terfezia boudieri ATCC MYA-4762 TaxID=1051890 RepID=A0A3N4LM90_9PEZI|nr:hypothetical protein L211DRAFT_302076 [Terfezia boudieri ATCC MYA-4762]
MPPIRSMMQGMKPKIIGKTLHTYIHVLYITPGTASYPQRPQKLALLTWHCISHVHIPAEERIIISTAQPIKRNGGKYRLNYSAFATKARRLDRFLNYNTFPTPSFLWKIQNHD